MCVSLEETWKKGLGYALFLILPFSVSKCLMFSQLCLKSCCTFSGYGLISWYSLTYLKKILGRSHSIFWVRLVMCHVIKILRYFRQDLNMGILVVKAAFNILEPRLSGCTCTRP